MQIYNNKAVLLKVRNPQQITTVIPKSKLLDDGRVMVNWGLEEMQVLKNIGIRNVPSPINRDYKWPGVYTPFAHQKVTAEFLTLHRRAFCFNEQGTSKTASAAWAADYLMTKGAVRRVLVVCPLSIMDVAWRADLFRTTMHRRVDIAHGNAKKRKAVINSDAEIVITNYDTVTNSLEDLMYGGFDLIVADECSLLKTATTKRWKCFRQLVGPSTWLWMLTGTPAAQSPLDAYGLAKLVNPDGVPKFFSAFRDLVMTQLTPFKWVPKSTSKDVVFAALQPAIRFTKEECLDLPPMMYVKRRVEMTPQQNKFYNEMKKKLMIEAAGEQITAANAAVKLGRLIQIACIAQDTPVLTSRGWVPIQEVTPSDKVWDGEEWVTQKGAVFKGVKEVVSLEGAFMTPDHKVWAEDWVAAEEILNGNKLAGFNRYEVRLPDSFTQNNVEPGGSCEMDVPMRLWECSRSGESVSASKNKGEHTKLRLRETWEHHTRDGQYTPVQHMDAHEKTVPERSGQRLEKLWRAGNKSLRQVAGVLQQLLGRHAGRVLPGALSGQNKRKWALRADKLQVGNGGAAVQQHEGQQKNTNPKRRNDNSASRPSVRAKSGDIACADISVQLAGSRRTAPTYDLWECGPRSRFTIKGENGRCMIVHNCGAVYTDDGDTVEFDITSRYKVLQEIIAETTNKVLIFAPYRHVIQQLHRQLNDDGVPTEIINGDVSATKRADIFKAFQTEDSPRVLVIQPQAASHGVTLTAADTVVWWGPTPSVETYQQANARVHRPGQKSKCTVFQLFGSDAEVHMYSLLDRNLGVHSEMINLYKKVLE